MQRQRRKLVHKPQTIAEWIILLAVTGITLTSPYGGRVVTTALKAYLEERAHSKKEREQLESRNISQALYRLKKKKIIRIKKKGDKVTIVLTEKGRLKKLVYDIERLKVPRPQIWDKHWRFLVFDIPEDRRSARNAFRDRLKQLGFIQFQQSIWIYPYPCEEEVEFLAETLKVNRFMTLLTVKIDNDQPLRKSFSKFGLY